MAFKGKDGNKPSKFDKNSKKTYTREYKKEQIQKNINKKKIMKKKYEKLLKSEGYEVDAEENKHHKEPKLSYKEQKQLNIEKLKEQKRERRAKKRESELAKFKNSKEHREEHLKRIAEIKEKNVQRKKRNEKLNVKTKKGQPVMSFKIDDLLQRIQNQQDWGWWTYRQIVPDKALRELN